MTAIIYHMQRRQWRGRHWILLLLMLCWKSENPCTYVASLPSASCPVLALSSLDPVFLLVWSWQQNAGTFHLMCHCVAHIGSLSSWHAAGSHFWTFSQLCAYKTWKEKGEIRIQKSPIEDILIKCNAKWIAGPAKSKFELSLQAKAGSVLGTRKTSCCWKYPRVSSCKKCQSIIH